MTLVEQIVTQRNQSADWLAKQGADLVGGVWPRSGAATVRKLHIKREKEIHAALRCAATFRCQVETWQQCGELKPKKRTSGPLQTQ